MKAVSKIIFFLLVVGTVLKVIKTLYVQNNSEYIQLEQVYDWYYKAGYYGNYLMTMGAVLSYICYRQFFPGYVSFCYIALILLVVITSLGDLAEVTTKPSLFYSVKGIGTYINFGILFFAASTDYFKKYLKIFYFACFVFIIAGIINLGKVGFGASRDQYLNALREFAVYLMWVFPFFLFQDEENKKLNLLNIGVFGVIFIFILCTGARSYLAIYLIFFFIKFKAQLQTKNSMMVILGTIILGAGMFFVFANSGLGKALEGAVNNLSERAGEDSRSEQLTEFLSQYNPDYLIQGVGPLGTWNWSHWPVPYYYLDNQLLLTAWWAGLPTLLVYLYFIIKPITQRAELQLFEDVKGIKTLLFFWLLACAGFAIYVGIVSDPYYDFITLLIGMQTCKYSLLLTEDEDEDEEET